MLKNVLVVEQEYMIAMHLKLILESQGWKVLGPAATVRGALKLMDQEPASVAILDVNLGNEFVTPVAEALKARHVPFAVSTAYQNPEDFGGAVLAGAPNVGKPLRERRVLDVVSQLTAAARPALRTPAQPLCRLPG